MHVKKFVLGVYEENSYLIIDDETSEAIVIDPGEGPSALLETISALKLTVKYILNTHAHIDHVLGVEEVKKKTGAPFYLCEKDIFLLDALPAQAEMLGVNADFIVPTVDGNISEGDVFEVGSISLKALETPGHSPGSVSFVSDDSLFAGDALFAGSVGRIDLPGGSWDILRSSLQEKICVLDRDTVVYSGHGPETTIGKELDSNPYLQPGVSL